MHLCKAGLIGWGAMLPILSNRWPAPDYLTTVRVVGPRRGVSAGTGRRTAASWRCRR